MLAHFQRRARRPVLVAAGLAATALVASPLASSALVVRLSIAPERPRSHEVVHVLIRTYAPVNAPGERCGFQLRPWRVNYPFDVEVVTPRGGVYSLHVRQARANRYVGRFRPWRTGLWTIRIANFGPRYESCTGSVLHFRVRR